MNLQDYLEGQTLLIDKPIGWSSFDVVKKIKYKLIHGLKVKKIKVGHAGTLDPLASGLLVVCTGKKTKTITAIQDQKKAYKGIITVGSTTPSYDLETEPENFKAIDHLTEGYCKAVANSFIGENNQRPPLFSAKKINGKRAYLHARKGEDIELKRNLVHIYDFELSSFELPDLAFRINCSKGTYIRSIAHDFGKKLEVGGYLKSLRRTAIGDFKVQNALTVKEWEEEFDALMSH